MKRFLNVSAIQIAIAIVAGWIAWPNHFWVSAIAVGTLLSILCRALWLKYGDYRYVLVLWALMLYAVSVGSIPFWKQLGSKLFEALLVLIFIVILIFEGLIITAIVLGR